MRTGRKRPRAKRAEFMARPVELGAMLAGLRTAKGLSLREVEEATGKAVSNAYLSQLENGKIRKPSPNCAAPPGQGVCRAVRGLDGGVRIAGACRSPRENGKSRKPSPNCAAPPGQGVCRAVRGLDGEGRISGALREWPRAPQETRGLRDRRSDRRGGGGAAQVCGVPSLPHFVMKSPRNIRLVFPSATSAAAVFLERGGRPDPTDTAGSRIRSFGAVPTPSPPRSG